MKSDFRRATDLSAAASGIKMVINSTNTILHNLKERNYADEKSLTSVSLAILASGALKEQFDQVIKLLGEYDETKEIDFNILKTASESIHNITKDIANPVLSEESK